MSEQAAERSSRKVKCPSCGAPVRFRGATSIVSVCAFCKSTLVRDGVEIENIGKQAELLQDISPIRVGTEGHHRSEGFAVVGRIQYRYESGVWNEWHVLFPRARSAWLSDASGDYTIAYLIPPQPLPGFAELEPGRQVEIKGEKWYAGHYTVMNLEQAEVVAGEGELPFRFGAGWKADVADLRGDGARFATIDYSETPPHLYVGEKLPFDTFRFSGLRDPDQPGFTRGTGLAFKCGGCGAPIEKHLTTTEVVACGSCGTVTDVKSNVGQVVQKNELNMSAVRPLVPLGSTGKWKGAAYEVVGFMRRGLTVEGIEYQWSEYLLHNTEQGYAWLTEYDGHFNWVHNAAEVPKRGAHGTQPTMKYLGRTFRHFQRATALVRHVQGEFYWRVKVGESNLCDDYVDPPLLLSSEKSGKEITWSVGEYLEPAQVWQIFNLKGKPPTPVGVAPNQPSPHKGRVGRYWLAFLAFLVLGLLLQAIFSFVVAPRSAPPLTFVAGAGEPARAVSAPFKLGGWAGAPVTVRTDSNAASDWIDLSMQLTNVDMGKAYFVRRGVGYRMLGGRLDGSNDDVAEVSGIPPGTYTLAVEARSARELRGTVQVYRSGIGWSNFWLFAGFLFLWPLVATVQAASFEGKRWSESDYASSGHDDDDDE
ncbi:MAG TPA: DUF4178 domain-containing protein [Usitatibacter sp.]|nr:DUF4178 domain-containing protein [Usitatibacter sp.]